MAGFRWIRLALIALCAGCGTDPTIGAIADRLGPEQRGVPPGPEHRPGQPCVTCHHGSGPGDPEFSLAGTVYVDRDRALPLEGASVEFLDALDRRHTASSNCAGNFYVEADDWQPRFPVWVEVRFGAQAIAMKTPIQRDGSCATCHSDPAGPDSAGHVYLSEELLDLPAGECR
jgi:hypothetical protein